MQLFGLLKRWTFLQIKKSTFYSYIILICSTLRRHLLPENNTFVNEKMRQNETRNVQRSVLPEQNHPL